MLHIILFYNLVLVNDRISLKILNFHSKFFIKSINKSSFSIHHLLQIEKKDKKYLFIFNFYNISHLNYYIIFIGYNILLIFLFLSIYNFDIFILFDFQIIDFRLIMQIKISVSRSSGNLNTVFIFCTVTSIML